MLNIIFIPRYGGIAAAWATVVTEFVVSTLMS
ncbi:MAG: polysaccharide biosynthesis C-terminal domain-containing protein [bacterium]